MQMITTIDEILNYTKTRNVYHTHVSMGAYKAKHSFSKNDLELFWKSYNPERDNICLAEKPNDYTPVIVDIDIKRALPLTQLNGGNVRTNKHVLEVVRTYQQVLSRVVNELKPVDLTCVFLDKAPYEITQQQTTYRKEGFHLHFPYLFLNKFEQKIHLLPRVKQIIKEKQTFKDLGFDDSSILIDDITSNAWLIYGASKDENMDPYKVAKVFDSNAKEISLTDGLLRYPIEDIQDKKIKLKSNNLSHYLPKILSIIPLFRSDSVIKELKSGLVNVNKEEYKSSKINKSKSTSTKKEVVEQAKNLLKMLNDERADSHSDWMKVGWILYNITSGSDEGFQLWDKFSSRSTKYSQDVCEYKWSRMKEGDLSIGTLHYYAKQDNKNAYLEFIRESNKNIIYDSLNGSHYDLAKIFHKVYAKNNVKITSKKDLTCFIWNEKQKLWVDDGMETLCKIISEILHPIYSKMGQELLLKLSSSTNKGDAAMFNARLKQIQKMMGNVKSSPYIRNVAKAYAGYEIDKDFETKVINRKPNEIPIKNGKVIDLITLQVRDRCFTDYWSFECNVNFLGEKADLSVVERFFSDISCGSKDLVDYHRRLWGYMLTGEISDRSLHIFWGNGCNGKSSVINIFSAITGDFSSALSEDVMLKKSSRGANPELMPLLTARCGALPESDKKEELNSKRVKSITGDDVITARHLYGHNVSFKTQCKPIWATNHKPKINIDDQAILDRLKLIPFLARFDKTKENTDYIKDLQENKLDEFFTWFCMGAYDWYDGNELIPCREMMFEMNKYISENDVVAEFIADTYELITKQEYCKLLKEEKKKWVLDRSNIYSDFYCWVTDNNRKEDMIGKKDFYKQIDKKLSPIQNKQLKIRRGFLVKKKDSEDDTFGCLSDQEIPPHNKGFIL